MKVTPSAAVPCAIALLLWVSSAVAQEVTPEIFGALPRISDAAISPDGRTLAMLQNIGDDTGVVFHDLDNLAASPRGTRLENAMGRQLTWVNDDTLLLMVSQTGRRETASRVQTLQAWRWLAISRLTLESKVIFGNEPGWYILSPGIMLASIPEDPNRVVFSRWTNRVGPRPAGTVAGGLGTRLKSKERSGGLSLFSVQLDKGTAGIATGGNPDTSDWIVDRAGNPVARVDVVDLGTRPGGQVERRIYTRTGGSKDLALVQTITEPGRDYVTVDLKGVSATTGAMLATTFIEGKRALVEFDMESGGPGRVVYHDPEHDIDGVIYDARTASVRGVRLTQDFPRAIYFDPAEQQLQQSLAAALPGGGVSIWSRSADGNRTVVKAGYVDRPSKWYLFDARTRELAIIGSTYPALDARVLATKERYEFTASDGLLIPGYLTVPAGASKTGLPMVVLPHGGPWARDDQSFDWWTFFYAARGYLVYQPNFRGSDGYGEAFRRAGDGQWGRKMQRDITEGVRSLIHDGIADPARICIVGGSYGGYAALAGATLTPGLYACAVSVNGVSHLGDLLGSLEGEARAFWEKRIGALADRGALHEVSPAHQAHRAEAAILLIHGRDDTVVPVGQSRSMAKALARHRKPHEFVELRGEDHWLSYAATRTEMLRRSIEFIDRHIGRAEN
jgi:dipeptidyl aminopeptidase/acylaminoacyl peptidase